MAEFVQTMKNWRRMCNTFFRCTDCPFKRCICPNRNEWEMDFNEAERTIEKWAAEHTEPVYPTLAQWLRSIGLANHRMIDPIPAEIAEKLGIEPKEVNLDPLD